MKILQVTKGLYPYSIGGIGVVVDNLSQNLINSGMNVEVLTLDLVGQFEHDKTYAIHNLKSNFVIYGNPVSVSLLLWLLNRRYQYDVIHAHSHLLYSTLLCALVRWMGSSPLIVTNHGLYSQTAPIRLSKIWLHTFGKFIYKVADSVICLSEQDKSVLIDIGIEESKITVVPNWIDTKKWFSDPLKTNKNRILFVGRLVPGKGVPILVDAFRGISEKIPSAKLVIVGSGPEEAKIKELVDRYHLNASVDFKKDLSEDELIEEYQKSAVFVLPSSTEGLPLTVLEAMSCGKPVVATADIRDIIGDAGKVVPYGSARDLEEAVTSILLSKNLYKECSAKGIKYAAERYSRIKLSGVLINIYNDLSKEG